MTLPSIWRSSRNPSTLRVNSPFWKSHNPRTRKAIGGYDPLYGGGGVLPLDVSKIADKIFKLNPRSKAPQDKYPVAQFHWLQIRSKVRCFTVFKPLDKCAIFAVKGHII